MQMSIQDEIDWQVRLINRLMASPCTALERMYHLYLLLQNQYYRLLVQSEEQFGFDQFQKLTFVGLRDLAEKDYRLRFLAMHGTGTAFSRTGYLEGRIAPKASLEKNHDLLHAVLGAYWKYLRNEHLRETPNQRVPAMNALLRALDQLMAQKPTSDRRHHRLAIVAHFIKRPWSAEPENRAGPYRFFTLRSELAQAAIALQATLERWPRLATWVRGIDGAANELHAPPEVFASCYRACARAGIVREHEIR
ncbi:hypothetical protein D769_18029, partial [Cupriavidus sp. HMR-1]